MTGIYKNEWQQKIRLCSLHSLIFFAACLLLTSCQKPEEATITIRWQKKRATGISIPTHLIPAGLKDSLDRVLTVRLAGGQTAMLGSYRLLDDTLIFEPLIPFTRGLHYTVWLKDKRLGEITIPRLTAGDNPALLAIYPSQDSLPENLLKIYLHFSRPMREGQSQQYVVLLKNNSDTLPGVFLDLQPELWNADRTRLTLWLDPGRIKRDLIPNKLLGAPLQAGRQYTLVVSAAWPDEQGATLGKITTKSFVTVPRDSLSPDPARWSVHEPTSGNVQPLDVAFGEALDYSLLTETLHVFRDNGAAVSGKWQFLDEEKRGSFHPDEAWQAGRYKLKIESRLEDMAGNNSNRPFDRDISVPKPAKTSQSFTELSFEIR